MLLAIDPGSEQSGIVVYDGEKPVAFGKLHNEAVLLQLRNGSWGPLRDCYIETLKPRGMPTALEEMQAQLWAGRFHEAFSFRMGCDATPVYRMDVKLFHCGQARAKDSNIRQALIDRFGGKEAAIGKKATPGPLYGVSNDVWSALAIAVYAWETKHAGDEQPHTRIVISD
mgnify:FL=1